ncbi:MAG TPA: hypothetical protein ENK06_04480 [Gammaproteobacteria bacterium]|nr:hypothetical protein [Gammaproteobacteria bacterium]
MAYILGIPNHEEVLFCMKRFKPLVVNVKEVNGLAIVSIQGTCLIRFSTGQEDWADCFRKMLVIHPKLQQPCNQL